MTSGCGCLHPTGDGCSWFWTSHKGEYVPIERNLEGRMTPTETETKWRRSENSKKSPSTLIE